MAAPPPVSGMPREMAPKAVDQKVDIQPNRFDMLIEMQGYRLVWERGALCPCTPNNVQTKQPDPNCPFCKGIGWFYFRPSNYVIHSDTIGALDSVQAALVAKPSAVMIRGILSDLSSKTTPYDTIGRWPSGQTFVTVRAPNKIGYFDRLTNLDATISFSETVTITSSNRTTLQPRYPIVAVNTIRSLVHEYTDEDMSIVAGNIVWNAGKAPSLGTIITLHYLCHPTWLITEHPHAIRATNILRGIKRPPTRSGRFAELPLRALVRYEFLPMET
jgi:hypothetical protein